MSSLGHNAIRFVRRFARAGLVSGSDSELVFLAFRQSVNGTRQLIGSRNFGASGPIWRILGFDLDHVAFDWSATIILGRCPFQVGTVLVPVLEGQRALE